jgi:YegS/Rv2252/BmrU family lipid kinase
VALKRLKDFDPNYLDFEGDIIGFKVYAEEERVGSVEDILLNESGHFQYLVVDFGLWIFNKRVIIPVGRSRVDYKAQRVYVLNLNRKQVENLPEYDNCALVDDDHEEQIRGVYRTLATNSAANSEIPEDQSNPVPTTDAVAPASAALGDLNTNHYQREPDLYKLNDRDHSILKQYQDRLLARGNYDNTGGGAAFNQPEVVAPRTTVSDSRGTRSACLIFNPVAGQSDSEEDLATIRRILQPKVNLDIRTTTPNVEADQLAREAVEQGAEIIIAAGGDGTLSAAAGAVVGTGVPFGVISRGTANAFATALGIPLAIEAACETILDGKTRVIDAAYCNGKPMVLLAGIGFEAETVERTDRKAKNRFGMLAYVLAGVQELSDFKSFETRIETEDKVITFDAAAITIANAAPPTSVLAQGPAELVVDDGLLDVTIVAPANSIGAIAAAFNLLQSADSDATINRSDTGYLRARSIKVTTNPPQEVVLDGELIGYTPVEVECIPGGLTILVPTVPENTPTEKLEGLPNLHIELKEPEVES